MIMGSCRKQGCPLSQFCVFLFRPLFSLLHFLSCPDLLFQIGFPFHNCETKPYAPHTQNQNEQKKAKVLEKILDPNILENPESPSFFFLFWVVISIVFFFSFALS